MQRPRLGYRLAGFVPLRVPAAPRRALRRSSAIEILLALRGVAMGRPVCEQPSAAAVETFRMLDSLRRAGRSAGTGMLLVLGSWGWPTPACGAETLPAVAAEIFGPSAAAASQPSRFALSLSAGPGLSRTGAGGGGGSVSLDWTPNLGAYLGVFASGVSVGASSEASELCWLGYGGAQLGYLRPAPGLSPWVSLGVGYGGLRIETPSARSAQTLHGLVTSARTGLYSPRLGTIAALSATLPLFQRRPGVMPSDAFWGGVLTLEIGYRFGD